MRGLLLLLGCVLVPVGARAQTFDEALTTLAAAETIDDAMVGIDGHKSEAYRAYEALSAAAKPAQLRALLRHDSRTIRGYAARALMETEVECDWPAILLGSMHDTGQVTTFQGCCLADWNYGDYLFDLARRRGALPASDLLDLGERYVTDKSPLYAREWCLRNLRFRDRMLHTIRALAKAKDAPAAIALARYGLGKDVPILIEHLRRPDPFDDNCRFLAALASKDPRLLPALLKLDGAARRRIGRDNPLRLRFWLQAIAVHQNRPAADFLLRFLGQPIDDDWKRRNLRDTMNQVLAPYAEVEAFAPVRAALLR